MKIVLVNGSIKKGTTYEVLQLIEKTLTELGDYEFEYIHMSDTDLNYCKSCFQCFIKDESKCFQYNKSYVFKTQLLEADGIIFSSPVYAMNISGAMKNFIDSITYLFHRPEFQTKKGMAVSTTMGSSAKTSAKYLKSVLKAFGVNDCSTLAITQFGQSIETSEKLQKQIIKSATHYHKMLNKPAKSPSFKDVLWFNMWKATTQITKERDYEHWQSQGWYKSSYYFDIKINPIKKLVGFIAYKFLRMVMPSN